MDGNPLSPASDRAEARARTGLLAVFLTAGPVVALAAGGSVSHMGAETSASARHVHAVKAVLLRPAPTATDPYATAYQGRLVWVAARWDTAGGSARTGQAPARAGSPAGSVVTVWLDASGRVTTQPGPGAFADDAALAAVMTLVAVALALRAALQLTRRFLNRRRPAAWEAAWSAIGPRWTGRKSLPRDRALRPAAASLDSDNAPRRSISPGRADAHVAHGYVGDANAAIIAQIERFAPGFRDRIVAQASYGPASFAAGNPNFAGGDIITGAKEARQLVFGPSTTLWPYHLGIPGHVPLLGGHAAVPAATG